ncbi:MAG: transposase [Clostridiales bacterium]|nr:transposase [Clostridiales bacterium]
MTDLPKRKHIRLDGFDYSSNGAYFVTICVADKRRLLWDPVPAQCVPPNNAPPLSAIGKIIDAEIHNLNTVYENITVDKYCIMPDHIHMILLFTCDADGRTQTPTLSRVMKQFKGSLTKQIGYSIWQKSFNDRIIRSEQEYIETLQYIDNNPLK